MKECVSIPKPGVARFKFNLASILVVTILFSFQCFGQSIKDYLHQSNTYGRFDEVRQFYQLHNYQIVWLNDRSAINALEVLIQTSDDYGLNKPDYKYELHALRNFEDSMKTDIEITNAAIHFFTELKIGNQAPPFGYNGLNYVPDAKEIPGRLAVAVREGTLPNLFDEIQPQTSEYKTLIDKLKWFHHITKDPFFKEIKIVSKKNDTSNTPLVNRLYQLGFIDSGLTLINNKQLIKYLEAAQAEYDVMNDGILRTTFLNAINLPLTQRIRELSIVINYTRWLEQIKKESTVLALNLPSANFTVYDHGKATLYSKVIVGKQSTPTPTITSTITEVILYPFWQVPHKIASRELLPYIKRNISFLENGNYQVLNSHGKVLNPNKIPWHKLSSSYFPYIIRQSTGCDNALDIVKFNFYNPFTVYLHDTPGKNLFSFNKRYFSHGCMRVEKPIELAHILLGKNNIAIDTLTEKGCINAQSPIVVPVEQKLPVIILYSTVWINEAGELVFYDDIYGKLN